MKSKNPNIPEIKCSSAKSVQIQAKNKTGIKDNRTTSVISSIDLFYQFINAYLPPTPLAASFAEVASATKAETDGHARAFAIFLRVSSVGFWFLLATSANLANFS